MKKWTALLIIAVICMSFTQAQDFEKLQASHITAMKYYGHAPIMAERNHKMVFMPCGNVMASACIGTNMATAYAEKGDRKIYWHVEKIEGGLLITIKINIAGITITRSFKITMSDREICFADLNWADQGQRIDWSCVLKQAPGCAGCGTDWMCWLGCAGSAILKCL
jgi:hypothetical protein